MWCVGASSLPSTPPPHPSPHPLSPFPQPQTYTLQIRNKIPNLIHNFRDVPLRDSNKEGQLVSPLRAVLVPKVALAASHTLIGMFYWRVHTEDMFVVHIGLAVPTMTQTTTIKSGLFWVLSNLHSPQHRWTNQSKCNLLSRKGNMLFIFLQSASVNKDHSLKRQAIISWYSITMSVEYINHTRIRLYSKYHHKHSLFQWFTLINNENTPTHTHTHTQIHTELQAHTHPTSTNSGTNTQWHVETPRHSCHKTL